VLKATEGFRAAMCNLLCSFFFLESTQFFGL